MSLIEETLEGRINKIEIAIERLKMFEPPEGYYLAFSGGKDSITIYELAKMSGVKFDAHFNFTTVDPPEVLRFIRENYPDVIWDRPQKTMWQLIEENQMLPTRIIRFCCDYLKERGGEGRLVITGVRSEESVKRKNRPLIYDCKQKGKTIINPIIDWTEIEVWEFIKKRELKYCSLYDEGYKRIGCVMCPMKGSRGMAKDKEKYPNFYKAYLKAVKKLIIIKKQKGTLKSGWEIPEKVMEWWINKKNKGQEDKLFD